MKLGMSTISLILVMASLSFAAGNVKLYAPLEFPDTTIQSSATVQGPVGIQGAKGDTGSQGPTGIQGPVGAQGPAASALTLSAICAVLGQGTAQLPSFCTFSSRVGTPFTIAATVADETAGLCATDGTNVMVPLVINGAVYAQLISSSGVPLTLQIALGSTMQSGNGDGPRIWKAGSRYVMSWIDNSSNLMAQFFDLSGVKVGGLITISSLVVTPSESNSASVAFDGTNYFLTWVDSVGGTLEVYGRLLKQDGTFASSTFGIATGAGYHQDGHVMFDGTNYLVSYMIKIGTSSFTHYGQFYSTTGTKVGSSFIIATSAYGLQGGSVNGYGKLFYMNNSYQLLWLNNSDSKLYRTSISTSGTVSPAVALTSSGVKLAQNLSFDGSNFLTSWIDTKSGGIPQVYGQMSSLDGTLIGSDFQISNGAGPNYGFVMGFVSGKYFAGWNAGDSPNSNVMGVTIAP